MSSPDRRGRSPRIARLRRARDVPRPVPGSTGPHRIAEPIHRPPPGGRPVLDRGANDFSAGWDHTASELDSTPTPEPALPSLRLQILSLLADPRVEALTVETCMKLLGRPRQDVETTLDAMVQAGDLVAVAGPSRFFRLPPPEKERLEAMFRSAAHELGDHTMLAECGGDDRLAYLDDEGEEPRLPVTAGLLSLFLPGTGQLLNGDVGRASLVFAVWSLAWITHLSPVWTFVCLYAGAEAFFTAKIRGMERKLAKDVLPPGSHSRALPEGSR